MFRSVKDWLSRGRQNDVAVDAAEDADAEEATSLMHRFRPIEQLGKGGMAVVHDVEDVGLKRRTALKVMDEALAETPVAIDQFVREAQITGQLEHPNIIPFYEFGVDAQGTHYINMRKIDGAVLDNLIDKDHVIRLQSQNLMRLLDIVIKVLDALAYAHSRGVVHRDIKPDNIIVGPFAQTYLLDWGVALIKPSMSSNPVVTSEFSAASDLNRDRVVVGTPAYMSPELATGRVSDQDAGTDTFLVGATLYQILAGRPPFHAKSVRDALALASEEAAPDPHLFVVDHHLPPGLVHITMKALSRDVSERYTSATELRDELEAFVRGAGYLPRLHFRAGETVITEGDEGDAAYVIASGTCQASQLRHGEPHVLRDLRPGDVFGEMAILMGGRRTSSVTALTDVELQVVSAASLKEGIGVGTWFGAFVTTIAERFVEAEDKLRRVDGTGNLWSAAAAYMCRHGTLRP